jgi:hypothetical protein
MNSFMQSSQRPLFQVKDLIFCSMVGIGHTAKQKKKRLAYPKTFILRSKGIHPSLQRYSSFAPKAFILRFKGIDTV